MLELIIPQWAIIPLTSQNNETHAPIVFSLKGRRPQPDDTRTCEQCGRAFVRRRFKGNRLEDRTIYHRRRFCSRHCAMVHRNAEGKK